MSGCYWRTAFCLVLLTLCSLCLYFKCVEAFYALFLAHCFLRYVSYVFRLNFYFKCMLATYALLLAQCSCSLCYSFELWNAWVLQCSLHYVHYDLFISHGRNVCEAFPKDSFQVALPLYCDLFSCLYLLCCWIPVSWFYASHFRCPLYCPLAECLRSIYKRYFLSCLATLLWCV